MGTGAADWKEEDWAKDGFSRRLTCAAVDADLLIDCGPTLFASAEKANFSTNEVQFVLSTHLHRDHFNLDTLARLSQSNEITFICPASAAYAVESLPQVKVIPLELFSETAVGDFLSYRKHDGGMFTFAGDEFFERMKLRGLYTTDIGDIRRRIAKAGLSGRYNSFI